MNGAGLESSQYRTIWFAAVRAVAEFALPAQLGELFETVEQLIWAYLPKAEFANSWRVD